MAKPRFRASGGKLTPVNNAARRAALLQQAIQTDQIVSRQGIANQARRKSSGGTGG